MCVLCSQRTSGGHKSGKSSRAQAHDDESSSEDVRHISDSETEGRSRKKHQIPKENRSGPTAAAGAPSKAKPARMDAPLRSRRAKAEVNYVVDGSSDDE